MRIVLVISVIAGLAACGGSGGGNGTPSARGEVRSACMDSGRKNATAALCGCVQSVADDMLSASDQRRAARFFDDPQLAQETRQSDRRRDETFWTRYRAFTDQTTTVCQAAVRG